VEVVGHDRVGVDLDGKNIRELAKAVSDPSAAVFVILARDRIPSTEKCTPDTT
jgi:hypothetical protein